ncbi:hypothetical protein Bca4012_006044 [Brassica carinata]
MERRSNSNLKIKQSYSMIKTVQEDFRNNEWRNIRPYYFYLVETGITSHHLFHLEKEE